MDKHSFAVLFGREIDESPIFKEAMNSNNGAYISHQVASAMGRGEMFFYILSPHANHRVAIVFIKSTILFVE